MPNIKHGGSLFNNTRGNPRERQWPSKEALSNCPPTASPISFPHRVSRQKKKQGINKASNSRRKEKRDKQTTTQQSGINLGRTAHNGNTHIVVSGYRCGDIIKEWKSSSDKLCQSSIGYHWRPRLQKPEVWRVKQAPVQDRNNNNNTLFFFFIFFL